jgi:hypothetical protein
LEGKVSDQIPVYPRPGDYFSPGDRVVFFLGDWPEDDVKLITTDLWVFGVIGEETSFFFGDPKALAVSIVFDFPIHDGLDPCLVSCLAAEPSLMPEWEYHYFLNHPDEIVTWAEMVFPLASTKMIQSLIEKSSRS